MYEEEEIKKDYELKWLEAERDLAILDHENAQYFREQLESEG